MNYNRFLINFKVGLEALMANRFRATLTSLGIIFGVASVIAMLAIGNGAEKQILEQMKEVGINNLIIKPQQLSAKKEAKNNTQEDTDEEDNTNSASQKGGVTKRNTSPGLSLADAENIQSAISSVNYVSPEVEIETKFMHDGLHRKGRLVGVNNNFFKIAGAHTTKGYFFSDYQLNHAASVCIIGKNIRTKLFPTQNPHGRYIKCGNTWLRIVGVLENKSIKEEDIKKLSIRNINDDIFIPINTMLLRYQNRSLITESDIQQAARRGGGASGSNYHQLNRMVVNVENSSLMIPTTNIISKMLLRRHHDIRDFEIVVPALLLKQEQKTKNLFNIVLAVIASISLLVGGIGIMNIMLASVLERRKEIGLRMAIGATKRDVVTQFVSEAVCISITGGLIGILLGIALSYAIQQTTDILTIISTASVFISFTISIVIGLIFGILPAKRASKNSPVEALRTD